MRFFTAAAIAISASASLVAAVEKCDAQNIVDTCVSGYKSRIDTCNENATNDYICLCDVYRDQLICYNNCPNDPNKFAAQNTVTSYCQAAEPLRASASASMASVASVAATQSHASTAASATATATGSFEKATGSAAESAASATASSFQGDAGSFGVPVGAAFVAMLAGLL